MVWGYKGLKVWRFDMPGLEVWQGIRRGGLAAGHYDGPRYRRSIAHI